MRTSRRYLCLAVILAGVSLTGCQTHFGGMTLPSPRYLDHYPQYFTPDPAYPFQRETNSMLDPEGASNRAGGANPAALPAVGPVSAPTPAGPGR